MAETVAAVVVTYSRKQILWECMEALLSQTRSLGKIILIDNASTDGTPDIWRENGYLDKAGIDYLRVRENAGGSGRFHQGFS